MAYTGAYVFGDSLVDAGNAQKLAEWYGGLPFTDLPEGAPTTELGYYQGRFSNGYTFTDLISNKAIGLVSKPVFPYHYEDPWLGLPIAPFAPDPSGKNLNFAYGGARIDRGDEAVPDLDGQTDAFRGAVNGNADPNALYLFTFGGNDVRDLAPTGADPVSQAEAYAYLDEAAEDMLWEIGQVVEDGAHNIVITGLANVGLIPRYDRYPDNNPDGSEGDGVLDATEQMRSAAATNYSIYLDALIRNEVVPGLQAMGANVTYVPLMDYNQAGVSVQGALNANMPTLAALNGLTTAELAGNLLAHKDVVFFDDVHPNAQAHALLASFMNAKITGTPWVETLPFLGVDVDYRTVGSISVAGEVDKVSIAMVAGTTYTFQTLGVSSVTSYVLGQLGLDAMPTGPTLADPKLRLMSSAGIAVKSDDDSGAGLDPSLAFTTSSAGLYSLELSAVGALTGNYVLTANVSGAAMQAGNSYSVSNGSTLVIEGAGGVGTDVVLASVSYRLAAGSEIEVLRTANDKGKTALNLTGNEFAQTIVGNGGANVLEGREGADTLTGGNGNDIFVLNGAPLSLPGQADRITDYARGDVVDVGQILNLAGGINPVSGGYLRVTTSGMIQVDVNGGGDAWTTLSTINGTGAVTLRYVSGGVSTNLSVARTADASAFASQSDTDLQLLGSHGSTHHGDMWG